MRHGPLEPKKDGGNTRPFRKMESKQYLTPCRGSLASLAPSGNGTTIVERRRETRYGVSPNFLSNILNPRLSFANEVADGVATKKGNERSLRAHHLPQCLATSISSENTNKIITNKGVTYEACVSRKSVRPALGHWFGLEHILGGALGSPLRERG